MGVLFDASGLAGLPHSVLIYLVLMAFDVAKGYCTSVSKYWESLSAILPKVFKYFPWAVNFMLLSLEMSNVVICANIESNLATLSLL